MERRALPRPAGFGTTVPHTLPSTPSTLRRLQRRFTALFSALSLAGIAFVLACDTSSTDPEPTPTMSIAVSPATLTVDFGGNGSVQVTVTRGGGFEGAVNLSVSGVPAGATATFQSSSISGGANSTTLTISAGTAAPGQYQLTVAAEGSGVSNSTATLSLTISQPPSFTLALNPTQLTLGENGQGTVQATITRTGGFSAPVELSFSGVPAGATVTANPATIPGNASSSALTVGAGTAAPGTYTITVQAEGGSVEDDATFQLTIVEQDEGGFTLTANPGQVSIEQGDSESVTIEIARIAPYAGEVTLSLENAPEGLTGSFDPNPAAGNTATLTLTADEDLAAQVYEVTVRGTGSPEATTTISVTITEPADEGGFELSVNPNQISIEKGASGQVSVGIDRIAPYAGAVTLSLENAPAGLTGTFDPNPVAGGTSTLTLNASAGLTAQTYVVTIRGTGSPEATTTLSVTITEADPGPGPGDGDLAYSFCPADVPIWLAYQDGDGPWTSVAGSNGTFMLDIQSDRGGIAYVTGSDVDGYHTMIQFATRGELEQMGSVECGGKMIHGSLSAALGLTDMAMISLGNSGTSVGFGASLDFTIENVQDGPVDLLAARVSLLGGGAPRVILRRGIDLPNHGTITPPLDFAGEGFDPEEVPFAIAGANGDQVFITQSYLMGENASRGAGVYVPSGTGATLYAIPEARRMPGDLHVFTISATDISALPNAAVRTVTEFHADLQPLQARLGDPLTAPTVTVPATVPYVQPKLEYVIQNEYARYWSLGYAQLEDAGNSATLTMTSGYRGGVVGTVELLVPDLTGAAGWSNAWGMRTGVTTQWQFNASGWNLAGGVDAVPALDGAEILTGTRSGQFVP